MGSSKPFLARLNVASCLTSREAMGSSSGVSSGGDTAGEGVSTPGCPICEFIEAGPCGDQHKVWVACRGEAKEQEVDFVQHCADTFRTFFGCMLSHQDYYRPFLDAFHVDTELSQEAIDKARNEAEGQQQQQQQQAAAGPQPQAPPQQQQQQQHSSGHAEAAPSVLQEQQQRQQPAASRTAATAHSREAGPSLQQPHGGPAAAT